MAWSRLAWISKRAVHPTYVHHCACPFGFFLNASGDRVHFTDGLEQILEANMKFGFTSHQLQSRQEHSETEYAALTTTILKSRPRVFHIQSSGETYQVLWHQSCQQPPILFDCRV